MNMVQLAEDLIRDIQTQQLDDSRINSFPNYTDEQGITHVHVSDTNQTYELVDGEWVEKAPF